MADTPNYGGAIQAATSRRDTALSRLMMLAQARQRFTNMMYMKQKAQMAEAERKRKEFEGEGNKSSTGEVLGGAALGASLGSVIPGIGTALGAGVGALGGLAVGMMESKAQYNKEGKKFGLGEAFRSLPGVADVDQASRGKWDPSYTNPQAIGSLAMTGARVGAAQASRQGALASGPNWANGETETGYSPSQYLSEGVSGNTMSPGLAAAYNIPEYDPDVARNLGEPRRYSALVPSPYAPGALWDLNVKV